jgi:hypothetical protein
MKAPLPSPVRRYETPFATALADWIGDSRQLHLLGDGEDWSKAWLQERVVRGCVSATTVKLPTKEWRSFEISDEPASVQVLIYKRPSSRTTRGF